MERFNNWTEAYEWADENDRSLDSVWEYTGDERLVRQYEDAGSSVEMWERIAKSRAEGETARGGLLVTTVFVTEYIVVVCPRGANENLIHCDDEADADEVFTYEVDSIKHNNA